MLPFQNTAVTKLDMHQYNLCTSLLADYSSFQDAELIGSLAAKVYCLPDYKGILKDVHDLDFFFSDIPFRLKKELKKANLIDRIKHKKRGDSIQETVHWSEHEFYVFEHTSYGVVDVFEGEIGSTFVPKGLPYLNWGDKSTGVTLKLAHPGLLLAIILHPNDTDNIRMKRSLYLAKSFMEEPRFGFTLNDVIDVCTQTLLNSNVTNGFFQRTLARIENLHTTKVQPKYLEMIREISYRLPKY